VATPPVQDLAGPGLLLWRDGPVAFLAEVGESPADDVGRWRLGVALGAVGRYAEAHRVLRPLLLDRGATSSTWAGRSLASLAASTLGSHARQLGRHRLGQAWDERAARTASAAAGPGAAGRGLATARADAATGLVADAVGQGDARSARRLLVAATSAASGAGRRAGIRLAWVRAESALLTGDGQLAERAAAQALEASLAAGMRRHVIKSRLLAGVVAAVGGDGQTAVRTLRMAYAESTDLGLVTLAWPAAAVLADLDIRMTGWWRSRAGSALRLVVEGLDPASRRRFVARADIAVLLAAPPGPEISAPPT
jgi:hypothetical protein